MWQETNDKGSGRSARGGFFAAQDTQPYQPKGVLLGQDTPDSCVPACTRMLIYDQVQGAREKIDFSETYLRHVFATDSEGSQVGRIPAVLRGAGLSQYVYRQDLTFDDLKRAVGRGYVIARLARRKPADAHTVIIEEIDDEFVALRDPLPLAAGSAYKVAVGDFLTAWASPKTGWGQAVVVVE